MAVPYDKSTGFCLMNWTTYLQKLDEILSGPQIKAINFGPYFVREREAKFNKRLSDMMKWAEMSSECYQKVRPGGLSLLGFTASQNSTKKNPFFLLSCPYLVHNTTSFRKN